MAEEVKDTDHTKNENKNKSSIDFKEEMGLYQIKLVKGGVVLVCNLCNEGFEMDNNIEKYLEYIHKYIVGPNKWTSCLDRWCGVCNECGLSKYE